MSEKLTMAFPNDPEGAPPAYDASASSSSYPTDKKANHDSKDEDKLKYLEYLDTVVLLDDSGSMRDLWKLVRLTTFLH